VNEFSLPSDPPATVRADCARVMANARSVRIRTDRIAEYAAKLDVAAVEGAQAEAFSVPELAGPTRGGPPPTGRPLGEDAIEMRCAYVLALDAVNFGSGFFPSLRKAPGRSGYRTIEAGLRAWVWRDGAPTAHALAEATPETCAGIFAQDLAAPIDTLMEWFARAWSELGAHVLTVHGGRFGTLVGSAGGSAVALVREMLRLPMWRDVATHDGGPVHLLKRAQIVVADLAAALAGTELAPRGLESLTAFADNLVPHVLRLDGLIEIDPELESRIEREALLEPGSPEEIELRASAVTTIELLAAELCERESTVAPWQLDQWLWTRGGGATYKARPRHRCRCWYY
jgi:hypothetical protein